MRKLGYVQHEVLAEIASGRREALYKLLDLGGRAASYKGRYTAAIARAVEAHNAGRCAANCPVPWGTEIRGGAAGPRGGLGYWIEM